MLLVLKISFVKSNAQRDHFVNIKENRKKIHIPVYMEILKLIRKMVYLQFSLKLEQYHFGINDT